MPELLLLCFLLIPQTVAGFYAKSIGKSFWFWFFISFLIPIISLIILVVKDKNATTDDKATKGYKLADHVKERHKKEELP